MTLGADLERDSELLPKDLPPRLVRQASLGMLALFVAILGFVCLVPLPEIVTARFVLKPDSGTDPVNAEMEGMVEDVRVRLGSQVAQGDVLIVLRSDELRKLAGEREQLRGDLVSARARLAGLVGADGGASDAALVSALAARVSALERAGESEAGVDAELARQHEVATAAAGREIARRNAEVAARGRRVTSLKRLAEQARQAHAQGVVSERDVLEREETLEDAQAELAESESLLSQARASSATLAAAREVQLRQRQSAADRREGELLEARAALADAKRDLGHAVETGRKRLEWIDRALEGAEGDRIEVRAPYAGSVVGLQVERPGVAVARGQQLCELARRGGELQAVLSIPEAEAAKARRGQSVRLLLDAFPYTLHGVRRAKLAWVSPSASGGALTAIAALDQSPEAVVDGPQGLRAGMAGEARVHAGSRTLLGYVLSPLVSLREGLGSEDEAE